MALIELATVIAEDPGASRRWAAEPLPLTDRLSAVLAARFAGLPEPGASRAAAGRGGRRPGPARSRQPRRRARCEGARRWPSSSAWSGWTGLACSSPSPLVRSAIYHSTPFAQRAAAHRQLAETLHDEPDRRAWHLAAASLGPDEQVASLLEATATQAQRRGGAASMAGTMERAPNQPGWGRSAIGTPRRSTRLSWSASATRAGRHADPELRLTARRDAGWALAYSGQRTAALPALLYVAEEASRDLLGLAWDALADAAIVFYHSGAPAGGQAVYAF